MTKYKHYLMYKPSGVEWLDELPKAWRVVPLKRYSSYISRGMSPNYSENDEGVPIINQACIHWEGLKLENVKFQDLLKFSGQRGRLYPGDLLVNSTGTGTLGRVGVFDLNGEYLADSHITIVRTTKSLLEKFLYYLLQTDLYQGYIYSAIVTGATNQIELSREGLGNTPIIVPPLQEQETIANFLDRETTRIDTLIAKKFELIDLLEKQRAAIVTEAVTKGCDRNVSTKDSGISWIGEIPKHWLKLPTKYVCLSVRDGTHNPPARAEGEYRLLSARNIQDGEFILRDDDRLMDADAFAELQRSYTVCKGDVVVAVVGATTGKSAVVGDLEKISVQRSIAILKPNHSMINSNYLNFWISSPPLQHEIALTYSKYAAQGGIYLEDLANLTCVLPPLKEQTQILRLLDRSFTPVSKAEQKLLEQIDELQKYRQALITAAVTGKIDVREEIKSDRGVA